MTFFNQNMTIKALFSPSHTYNFVFLEYQFVHLSVEMYCYTSMVILTVVVVLPLY